MERSYDHKELAQNLRTCAAYALDDYEYYAAEHLQQAADLIEKLEAENAGKGLVLTFDGATGYFPKEFIIEAIKAYMKQNKEG